MASDKAQPASTTASELQRRVRERFGVLPNFFRLSPETPEITEKLWGFAQAAYLDNPLPSVFKERLFVYLSRFCAVRYCIARHTGFLIGLGRPAGDVVMDSKPGENTDAAVVQLDREMDDQLALRMSHEVPGSAAMASTSLGNAPPCFATTAFAAACR